MKNPPFFPGYTTIRHLLAKIYDSIPVRRSLLTPKSNPIPQPNPRVRREIVIAAIFAAHCDAQDVFMVRAVKLARPLINKNRHRCSSCGKGLVRIYFRYTTVKNQFRPVKASASRLTWCPGCDRIVYDDRQILHPQQITPPLVPSKGRYTQLKFDGM